MGLKDWYIKRFIKKQIEKIKKEKPEMFEWLKGKKTYLVALVMFTIGGLQYSGVVIPDFVFTALGALGFTTLRAGITKSGK